MPHEAALAGLGAATVNKLKASADIKPPETTFAVIFSTLIPQKHCHANVLDVIPPLPGSETRWNKKKEFVAPQDLRLLDPAH